LGEDHHRGAAGRGLLRLEGGDAPGRAADLGGLDPGVPPLYAARAVRRLRWRRDCPGRRGRRWLRLVRCRAASAADQR
jgi:hypothetical protein